MKRELLSMAQAAEEAQISKRTVQRYVQSGRLLWRGPQKRGRYAVGIDRGDLQCLLMHKKSDQAKRARKTPAWKRIERELAGLAPCLEGLCSPDEVIRKLLRAINGGACLDLSYLGIYEAFRGNHTFARIFMGDQTVSAAMMDAITYQAAIKLDAFASASTDIWSLPEHLKDKLAVLACCWYSVKPDVEPVIRLDKAHQMIHLDLSPKWLLGVEAKNFQPRGTLPDPTKEFGGDSIVKLYRDGDLNRAHCLLNRVYRHLVAADANDQLIRQRLTDLLRLDEWFDHEKYRIERRDLRYKSGANATPTEAMLHEFFDLEAEQVLFLDRMAKRIRGDLHDKATQAYNSLTDTVGEGSAWDASAFEQPFADYPDSSKHPHVKWEDTEPFRPKPTHRMLGDMFGVSRQTAAKWLVDGRMHLKRAYEPHFRGS